MEGEGIEKKSVSKESLDAETEVLQDPEDLTIFNDMETSRH